MERCQIPNAQHDAVTVAAFAAKYRSKREVYTFLTVDVKAFLPAPHTLTIYFLKDIITGKKKCKYLLVADTSLVDVKMSSVVHIHVPSFENLNMAQIFAFFNNDQTILQFLPDGKELRKVPKAWVCNVAATVLGMPFIDWVKARIDERNAAVVQEKNLAIQMDEDVAQCFFASTAVSRKYLFTLLVKFRFRQLSAEVLPNPNGMIIQYL